jgi:hypothetical protein
MISVSANLADRLNALKEKGIIAGWKDAGGSNYGRGQTPLPAKIFPIDGRFASSYYDERLLEMAVTTLETFGPISRPPVRQRPNG